MLERFYLPNIAKRIFVIMSVYVKIFVHFFMSFLCSVQYHQVSASKCENYWLDQYEDVLPSINDRPDFPAQLTEVFQVSSFSNI